MMIQVGWVMLILILINDENGNEVTEKLFQLIDGVIEVKWLRCKTIGDIPTSLINGGNASVVNGNVVYDPTP